MIATTGGPNKELGINKLPPTGRIQERSKGERTHKPTCPTNLSEFSSLVPSWLSDVCNPGRTLSQNDWPETSWKLIPSPFNLRL